MAITVTTTYSFVTDDGTAYGDTVTETIDQDEDARDPLRYQFGVGTTREQVLDVSTDEEFGAAQQGSANTMLIINRDDSNASQIYVSNAAGDDYTFILGPDEWHYLPVSQSDLGASGFSNISQIDAKFFNASGTLEILVFYNPGS